LAEASSGLQLAGGHLARLVVAFQFEGDLLAFDEVAHAGALYGRNVDEYVRAAVVRLNEAEALGGIEPFYCAGGHDEPFHSNIDIRRTTLDGCFRLLRGGSSSRGARRHKQISANKVSMSLDTRAVGQCQLFVLRTFRTLP